MTKRAATISMKELAGHVDAAVAKLDVRSKLEKGFVVDWTIFGRYLLDHGITLEEAGKTATAITHGMGQAHGAAAGASAKLEPAVLMSHGRIICGFLPPREFGVLAE